MLIAPTLTQSLQAGHNLPQVFAAGAAAGNQEMAFLDRDGVARTLPYASLYANAAQITLDLVAQGLRSGDPVILCCDDEYLLVQLLWAILLAGGVAVPLSAPRSYSASDDALAKLAAVAAQCATLNGAAPWVITDLDGAALQQHVFDEQPLENTLVLSAEALLNAASRRQGSGIAPAPQPREADALAILMYSSGSTGDAKGVRLTHRQILANVTQICERSALTPDDRSLSWLPLTHDMGLVLFHLCHVLAGISQYKMTPLAFARDPAAFLGHIETYRPTLIGMPNFGFDQLLRAQGRAAKARDSLSSIRIIYNGAEPIDAALCRRFTQHFGAFGLAPGVISPGWGIAEACVVASQFPQAELAARAALPSLWLRAESLWEPGSVVEPCAPDTDGAREIVALGPVMPGMAIRALDDAGRTLPPSRLGHLEIKGPNVSAGYFGQPDSEWCATGDLGFIHGDCLYLTGRAKDIVFVNGRNHFSNDLEVALCHALDWPANQLAVVGITDPILRREKVVVFFRQTRKQDSAVEGERLRAALEHKLAYPVAGAIGLSALPKTTSGKIRRFALRQALARGEFDAALALNTAAPTRPLSAAETQVLDTLRALYPHLPTPIDPTLPLARYGLDSVGYMQLAFRLSADQTRPVSPQALLAAGSLAQIAAVLASPSAPHSSAPAILGQRIPLTPRQQMLWTAWLLQPNSAVYNESYWVRLSGPLDTQKWLDAARRALADRAMLNAVVDDAQTPALRIATPPQADVAVVVQDAAEAQATMAAWGAQPFDLRHGPLARLRLIQCGPEDFYLFVSAHHIVVDGWSIHLLISQLFAVYEDQAVPTCVPALRFQPETIDTAALTHWTEALTTAQAVQLPTDAPHAPAGATQLWPHTLPQSLARDLKNWPTHRPGSEFAVIAAALLALFARLCQIERPLMGTVVSGRHEHGVSDEIGYFAHTLPLLARIDPDAGFAALVAEIDAQRPAMLGGQIPDLAALAAHGGAALTQAVRAVYVHQNMPPLRLPDALRQGAQGQVRGEARTDVYISSAWQADRLVLTWEYDSARFTAAQIAGYAELFEHVLTQVLALPERPLGQLDLLSPAQRALWRPYQKTAQPVDFTRHVLARFDDCATAHPSLIALSDAQARYTYGELRERVDALCWRFEEAGLTAGERVCLLTQRSTDYVLGLLAALKLGLVVVPVDPALPEERIRIIVEDCGAAALLVTPGLALPEGLLDRVPTVSFHGPTLRATPPHPGYALTPTDPAYLIFTSGSTGRPKGVLNTHRSLANLVEWVAHTFRYRPGETICQFAPFSFDVSLAEILPSLCAGLHVHVLSDARRSSPALYLDTLAEHEVAVATITPAYLAVLNEDPQHCRRALGRLRLLILGGEALKTDEVQRFRAHSPHVEIVNVYGPTETTVLSSAYPVPMTLDRRKPWQPLGLPIANTEIWVLDDAGRVCPASVTGTLHIGGDGLSQGYWQDAAKTAAAFQMRAPDGAAPRRFYCTGDLARLSPEGLLEFAGRADTQIKLRGFRIELGDIESALEQFPGIESAVVLALPREGQERSLVAYYTGTPQARGALDAFLYARLPAYMVPAFYQALEVWPLTPNRKVDRNRLPAPDWQAGDTDTDGPAPAGPVETQLAALWCGLLGLTRVGRHSHFFLLGGSSLSAAQLANRIRDGFGRQVPLTAIMQHPTLEALAQQIEAAPACADPGPQAGMAAGVERVAASDAQARMVFIERTHPGSALNNMPLTLSLGAALDEAALAAALQGLVHRHAMLRARFRLDPQGLTLCLDGATQPLDRRVVATSTEAMAALEAFHRRSFDLERGPLWRAALVSATHPGAHWLALSCHHALADGVTLIRMLTELDALYRGEALPTTAAEVSYPDYAVWQEKRLDGAFGEQAQAFWRAPDQQYTNLPLPGRAASHDMAGHQFMVDLDVGQTTALQRLCSQHGVSPFILMLSVFGFALGQRCESERFALGVTFSGRPRGVLEQVLGLFVNTLPLGFDWTPQERFVDLLHRTQTRLAHLQEFEDYPLNRVMALNNWRETPFDVLFNEEVLPAQLQFGGQSAALTAVGTATAKFPLVVSFLFTPSVWRWRMEYRQPGLPATWVDGLIQDVKGLIDALDGMSTARLEDLIAPDRDLLALLEAD